jgi:hypothetical protein
VTRGGMFRFCPEATDFARYHGFAFKACAARDAKRKGSASYCTSWVGCGTNMSAGRPIAVAG